MRLAFSSAFEMLTAMLSCEMLTVPSLDTSIVEVEVGSEEHPVRNPRTAKARNDILYSLCVCFMIELITLSSLPQEST
jgi:hypothetical protein